ncbi:BamA/TamA family outer membrane protein [Lutimonas halocynthiae]|uniref:BamA/TamA family outer membrane protein n=1 Tax=Lutimonas halocynthiae TaxID=1446477 RepID=UPI0025B40F13|nr:BamA/TamA family outer membrane protein [Lutimonas halocynthiae]MDN3641154.1 BamA/TamA family outer membrane protein [Lutimonas halocynthiae]
MINKFITLFILLLLLSNVMNGQTEKQQNKEDKKARKDSIKAVKVAEGRSLISPLLVPGYTPELGALLAVGGLWSFKTDRDDDEIQRSSMPFTLSYTSTGAVVFNAKPTTFWLKDKLRITADLWYKNMPDNYWGVGAENAINTQQSDSTTAYQREWWWINPQFLYQFKENYFAGLNVDYNYTKGSDPSEGVAEDPNYQVFNDRPLNSGLGLILRHDSRDIPVNAWEGFYLDVSATAYSTAFGGDNDYQIFLIDYRQYEQVGKPGQTMTWQVKARLGNGDIPYGEMGQLGNPFDLRGYTWGRFRDKSLFFVMPEYRHTFYKNDGKISKHGAVAWVGTGTVWDFDKVDSQNMEWLPNFGVGYRFELQPRMNLRLDVGIGQESSGIYFNFNESF